MPHSAWVETRIRALGLEPHPEGGFYREVYRSDLTLPLPRGKRSVLTAIHFVLPPGGISRWHRVRADECWIAVDGDPVELATLNDVGKVSAERLGRDLLAGEQAIVVVPAGLWQAARCAGQTGSHVVCTVAPGFDFADFTMAAAGELAARFPESAGEISRFS